MQDNGASVDMTPMLDIVFILLIFFIVTTSFVKEEGFIANYVKSTKADSKPAKNIMIHLDKNGILYFNNTPVDLERIPARVENFIANTPTDTIIFRPHEESEYQKVVSVLDQLQQFAQLRVVIGLNKAK